MYHVDGGDNGALVYVYQVDGGDNGALVKYIMWMDERNSALSTAADSLKVVSKIKLSSHTRAPFRGAKYVKECRINSERVIFVLLMGISGVASCLFRMSSMIIARFRTNPEWVFYFLKLYFCVIFALIMILEIIAAVLAEKYVRFEMFDLCEF
ncbi:hypothetical protein TNIN_78201 [Trichonephila inaurata madagascariensis]|uniref:Uncharacterized protein n=1 Tax=Trichonephila inaurata madagascariensis TaxID=2747483 RepID=A0A8X6X449_9ARAC|nr:hypothetical protein TNIN_78201 [Trichonephila inaurata madagascariensis]